jgi:preprotein translocase subunit SecA
MVAKIFKKVFGSRNERVIKRYGKVVEQINSLEEGLSQLSDDQLRDKTTEFRERFQAGESLDALLPEAFAVVREAGKRVFNMRHFDVQLIGGMVLHDGRIAEMRTGEGKTLVATLPAYLNAIPGRGVHIITVNDYLAKRDAAWMAPIYEFLGMTVGTIVADMSMDEKRQAYLSDITYGTNNQYGFDYLQDNLAFSLEDKMQRELYFAIVDEVDSILIDEARTPLIISGEAEESSDLYTKINSVVPRLVKQEEEGGPGDYSVDEKSRQVYLTEEGHENAERYLREVGVLGEYDGLYDAANISVVHHLNAALRAHASFQRDVHYVVKDGQIVIVDEFTGRTTPGRRWSDGLHQAIEAKEGVPIQSESRTVASITFQNYFRMYDKLAGMTGTADTEAYEFQQIYGLEVVVVPTHRPMIRKDNIDMVFLTQKEKYDAIIKDIKDCQGQRQPVLVGTTSIENSEYLSQLLEKENIKHEVLNAKQHAREAEIVVQAGRPGRVTIATNMAGRGTDIVLGGNVEAEIKALDNIDEVTTARMREDWKKRQQEVLDAGGLHIIGTERHESRRIDNQLRGRSGRQGDPGSSRFYLSLEDSLMRIFASERVSMLMQKLGMQEGEPIEHPWVTKAIENAQRKVEGHNFDIRKQLLEYDDVANDQRKVIYAQRNELLAEEDLTETLQAIRSDVIRAVMATYIPPGSIDEQWDVAGLEDALEAEFSMKLPVQQWLDEDKQLHEESLIQRVEDEFDNAYKDKEQHAGTDVLRHFEKQIMLQVLDSNWREHLASMDYLRQGIGLRGYAQKNPRHEYKREAFELFENLLDRIKQEVISVLMRVQVRTEEDVEAVERNRRAQQGSVQYSHPDARQDEEARRDEDIPQPFTREGRKIGRNEPCPCGSGKKYKQCHGKLA